MEKIYYNNSLLNRSSELRKDKNFLMSILDSENVNFIPMKDDENYFISGKEEIKPLILTRRELESIIKDIDFSELCITSKAEVNYENNIDVNVFTEKAKGTKCSMCWKINEKGCARSNCPQSS